MALPTTSSGRPLMLGIPPASETTSGAAGHREQGADLRGGHALRARGVPVDVVVEAGAACGDLGHDGTSMDHRGAGCRTGTPRGLAGGACHAGPSGSRSTTSPRCRAPAARACSGRWTRYAVPASPTRTRRTPRRRPGSPTVLRDWGSCGQLALVDDEAVGYVIYAPSVYVPGSANLPTAPVSVDALQMTTRVRRPGAPRRRDRAAADPGDGPRPDQARGDPGGGGVRGDPGRPARPVRGAGGLPVQRGLQDPAGAPDQPADADGAASRR